MKLSPNGGIGIRVRLKIEWRNPYGFKSHFGHHDIFNDAVNANRMGSFAASLQVPFRAPFTNGTNYGVILFAVLDFRLFVRSGSIDLPHASLRYGGRHASDWSDTTTGNLQAHYLVINESTTTPSGGPYGRWNGYPVRCLVY